MYGVKSDTMHYCVKRNSSVDTSHLLADYFKLIEKLHKFLFSI